MKKLLFSFVGFLLLWKLILFLWFPFPNADGPWSLSHTFSIINGDFFKSEFAHGYLEFYNMPYMSGLLQVPFYYFDFLGSYQIFFINIIYLLLLLFVVYRYLKKIGSFNLFIIFIAFAMTIITSTYTYSLRPELPIMILMVIFLNVVESEKFGSSWLYLVGASVLTAIIGLIHPIAGIYTVILFIGICFIHRYSIKTFLLFSFLCGSFVLILYGPIILIDIDAWILNFFTKGYEEDYRGLKIFTFLKYLMYSPGVVLLIGLLGWICKKEGVSWYGEYLYLCILIVFLFLFSRSYYYPYIIVYLLWRIGSLAKESKLEFNRVPNLVFAGVLICMPLFSHYWPTIQLAKGHEEVKQWKLILNAIEQVLKDNPHHKVWVSPHMGMMALPFDNARMHFSYYEKLAGYNPPLITGDILLAENEATLSYLRSMFPPEHLRIEQIVKPSSQGLIRFGYPIKYTEPMSLWKLTYLSQ